MKFLSVRRRHPIAGLVVLLLGLVTMGGAYALFAPSSADASSAQQSAIDNGRKLYDVSCATCHGFGGIGGAEAGAPSLIGVGAAAVDFQVSTGRMPLAIPGPQNPARRAVFTPQEISALAAYVGSLGTGPAIPSKADYSYEHLTDAQIAEGGELFRTNCAGCHNVTGQGGALPYGNKAPALNNATPKQMFEAMETGPQEMPIFPNTTLTPKDKASIIGYVKTVEAQPNPGGFSLGGVGPVSEGLATWIIGIGILIIITVWIAAKGVKVHR